MNIDETVRAQFRLDTNCPLEMEKEYRIMINERRDIKGARVIDGISSFFRAIIYRGDSYIMADSSIIEWASDKYSHYKPEWFCKYHNLRELDQKLGECGYEISDTHVYMLPDSKAEDCEYEGDLPFTETWLYDKEIDEWFKKYGKEDNPCPHALAGSENQPDRIGLLLTKGDEIVAMSGVSEDCRDLWQIGIDVLPGYEGHGLATYLTDMMKRKVISLGRIPFYGTSESHSNSLSTGIRAGFIPSWCEVFVKQKGTS